jgi:hypothetical protein
MATRRWPSIFPARRNQSQRGKKHVRTFRPYVPIPAAAARARVVGSSLLLVTR